MIKNNDIEPRLFNFRLFLDDYTIRPQTTEVSNQSLWKSKLSATGQRRSSRSDTVYYNELEELETFCCYDDEERDGCGRSRDHGSSFCLANFQPRKDSMGFNELHSIFSFGSNTKNVSLNDIDSCLQGKHFENLRSRLALLLDAGTIKSGLE